MNKPCVPAQTSNMAVDAQRSQSVTSGLGNFEKLPTELRLDIFERLWPTDFRQVFTITHNTIQFSPRESSATPTFLQTSKQLCAEGLAAVKGGRNCKLWIGLNSITTNFITDPANHSGTSIFAMNEIANCKLLEINIQRPSPCTAYGFALLRSNVHGLVDFLNNTSCKTLPKVTLRIQDTSDRGGVLCGYNDFAILIGPFTRLIKPVSAIMVYRTTGCAVFSPGIERQCDLLEQSIGSPGKARNLARFQQCNLEIKLPLAVLANLTDMKVDNTTMRMTIYRGLSKRAHLACKGLRTWYELNGLIEPTWLQVAWTAFESGDIPSPELQNEMLGGQSTWVLKTWAAGHFRAYNPFWNELTMGGLK